jgi:hypothetical protein
MAGRQSEAAFSSARSLTGTLTYLRAPYPKNEDDSKYRDSAIGTGFRYHESKLRDALPGQPHSAPLSSEFETREAQVPLRY